MASRHHSLEMTEVKDVVEIIQNFEEQVGLHIAFAMSVTVVEKAPRLACTATAFQMPPVVAEPAPLVSVSFSTSTTGHRFLKDVVTHGLYLLDAKLAWREMAGEP